VLNHSLLAAPIGPPAGAADGSKFTESERQHGQFREKSIYLDGKLSCKMYKDSKDELVQIHLYSPETGYEKLNNVMFYEDGKLVRVQWYKGDKGSESAESLDYYDNGQIVKKQFYEGNKNEEKVVRAEFYENGQLLRKQFVGGYLVNEKPWEVHSYENGQIVKHNLEQSDDLVIVEYYKNSKMTRRSFHKGEEDHKKLVMSEQYMPDARVKGQRIYEGDKGSEKLKSVKIYKGGKLQNERFYEGEKGMEKKVRDEYYQAGKLSKEEFYEGEKKEETLYKRITYTAEGKVDKYTRIVRDERAVHA
jgi:antitoxin component YwqK of YwqJK toxin-antitoxin module